MLKEIPWSSEWRELPRPGPATEGRPNGEERKTNGVEALRPSLSRSSRHMVHHGERPFPGSHRNALGRDTGLGVRNLHATSTGSGRAYAPSTDIKPRANDRRVPCALMPARWGAHL